MRRVLFALVSAAWAVAASAQDGPQTLIPVQGKPPAPPLSLVDIDGKRHTLAEQRGKVVLVNFWATWCPPCRREMPSMQRAWEKLKSDDFRMYAVNIGEDENTIFAFTFSTGVELTFPILLDVEGKTIEAWPVRGLPTTFVVDKQGRIAYSAVGGREWDDPRIIAEIQKMLRPRKR